MDEREIMQENIAEIYERTKRLHHALELCSREYPDQTRLLRHAWLATFNTLCALPSLERDGQISYSRNAENDTDVRRVRTSFGRFVRRQWKIEQADISDAILANIGTKITAAIGTIKIERLTGEEIARAYRDDAVQTCMSGLPDFVALYAENPESISLLAHRNDHGQVDARALLWTQLIVIDGHATEKLFLDREYGNPILIDAIRTEAKLLGADLRNDAGRRQAYWSEPVTIKGLRIPSTNKMPYMDSMRRGTIRNSRLTLSTCNGEMEFSSTDGGYIGQCDDCEEWFYGDDDNCPTCSAYSCEHCGARLSENEAHTVCDRTVCESCLDDRYFYCDTCEEYRSQNDFAFSNDHGSYCTEHAHRCQDCEEWTTEPLDDFDRCNDCTITCVNCGDTVESSDELYGENREYCQNCFNACVNCGAEIAPISSSRPSTQCADCAAVNLFSEKAEMVQA